MKLCKIILFLLSPILVYGQSELTNETLTIKDSTVRKSIDFTPELRFNMPSITLRNSPLNLSYSLDNFRLSDIQEYNYLNTSNQIKALPIDYSNSFSNIYRLNENQWISAYKSNTYLVGMGGRYNVGGMYNYKVGDFLTLSAGGFAGKYAFNNYLFNNGGFNANVQFSIGDYVKINAFGQYTLNQHNNSPFPIPSGLYPQTHFGGSMEVKITDRFGVAGGYMREFNPFTRKWENNYFAFPIFYK
ncbi:hypothetical protein LJB95_00655 [Paludibacteraceae bacterium OttesenSCG-928-F17]|nr:hypothetical protein [Paludibacteraceae bacterium OttesenSCG-928-F17]